MMISGKDFISCEAKKAGNPLYFPKKCRTLLDFLPAPLKLH
jgi:hypothetical protein